MKIKNKLIKSIVRTRVMGNSKPIILTKEIVKFILGENLKEKNGSSTLEQNN